MRKMLFALCLILPAISNAGLITHQFEAQLFDDGAGELFNTVSITLDADPETWSLGQAWIHIDGRTVASDQAQQLGESYWTYFEAAFVWKTRANFVYTFTDGDWSFAWIGGRTEIDGSADENPIYTFTGPHSFVEWGWRAPASGSVGSGGGMRITSTSYTHKVPEPHTLALFALGLAALGIRRRFI